MVYHLKIISDDDEEAFKDRFLCMWVDTEKAFNDHFVCMRMFDRVLGTAVG
jgi:hypothetical protein